MSLARVAVIVRSEAVAGVLPRLQELLDQGHAVHLGVLGPPPWPKEASRLWDASPRFSLGHAISRRDRWRRLAEEGRLPETMLASLPPDQGILAYLRQLDLDVLLLGAEGGPGSAEADYLIACHALKIRAGAVEHGLEAAVVPPPDAMAAIWRPMLWPVLAWDALRRPSEAAPGDGEPRAAGPLASLKEGYARRVYPALAATVAALAPGDRPLLRQALAAHAEKGELVNQVSAEGAMAAAAEGRSPIILGPWWGEPELEILYWVPFLRWWRRRYQVDKERLVAVSTGGSGAWYESRHLDLRELYDPALLAELEESRAAELSARGKRFGITAADRQILKRLDRRLGFRGLNVLPAWTMAVALEPYWSGQAGPALLAARTRPAAVKIKEKLARRLYPELPALYVAMGASEPEPSMEPVLRQAAERTPVVILAEPAAAAWADEVAALSPRLHAIALDPASAKGSASTVLAAARAYVGPHGWMAFAAAALGRPTVFLGGAASERQLIDQAAAARLFEPAPLMLSLHDPDTVLAALELVLGAKAAAEAH
jgi:hypothetical protein